MKKIEFTLDDLRWEPVKVIGPPFRIFLEGDEIVGMQFDDEPIQLREEKG